MSRQCGENHWNAKLTSEQVLKIRNLYDDGFSYSVIARNFKISIWNVQEIGKRKIWKHL